jgi:hypothetical protein
MDSENVSKVLNLPIPQKEPVSQQKKDVAQVTGNPVQDTDRDDFEFIRDNYYEMIQKGTEAATELLDIARQSQNAREFEVVATLIKSVNEANRDLSDLLKKKKEHFNEKPENPQTVNNNLFVGTTEDLQKLIKKTTSD